ncbi:YfhO family protein [Embleya sp. NBC_00896]|uniref:YfhO family protein n=1 Tax=Embleya sp. NBC_00896 TaxID=2975961 RepID=UPI003865F5BE|nr:YfhO family protein [Embleya sp. NBC_00896]
MAHTAEVDQAGTAPGNEGDVVDAGSGAGGRFLGPRTRRIVYAARGPLLAAFLAFASYCAACAVRGTSPFGSRSRAINDLANQFVPFHAHFWDLVHGRTSGDLFFNWDSAYGTGYLPDFYTYLMNPFSWFVALFPRDQIDLAVFLITPLSMALGAALMTRYLGMISQGPWWQRAVLGAGFGMCAWALDDASPDPMWMWGLASFPLMCIAVEWCLQGRRWVWATLFVAFSWGGNFYTAIMATIGAGVLFTVRTMAEDVTWRHRADRAVRAISAVGVGVMVTLPLLVPSYLASKDAQPAPMSLFKAIPGDVYLTQMLPATRPLITAPKFFVGTFALLLVLTMPFNKALAKRVRASWSIGLVLVGASYVWEPTQKLWHGMDIPNGSPYRAMFVLSGLIVIAAWLSLSHRPGLFAVLGAAAVIVAVALYANGVRDVQMEYTWWALLIGGLVALVVLIAPRLLEGRLGVGATRALGAGLAVLLAGGFAAEATVSAVAVDDYRNRFDFFSPKPEWGPTYDAKYAATREADGWPAYRTDTGPHAFVNNDAMLMDGQSAQYYSSYVTTRTANTLQHLGYPWWISGRFLASMENPVTDAIFSIGARISAPDKGSTAFRVDRYTAPPLVTVQPKTGTLIRGSVFAWQNAALGTDVYAIPQVRVSGLETAKSHSGTDPIKLNPVKGKTNLRLEAQCAPGSTAYLYAPWLSAGVSALGTESKVAGRAPGNSAPVIELGPVPATGKVEVDLKPTDAGSLPRESIGCLDNARLDRAVAGLKATGAQSVSAGGHDIKAKLPKGSTGTAVIATPANKGWTCERDGSSVKPTNRYGLLAVPLGSGASEVSCSYTPPGLKKGTLAGGAGFVALIAIPLIGRRMRRRAETSAANLPQR